MQLKDLGSALTKSAPLLGGALAGPAGSIVGSLIASIFGGSTDPNTLLLNISKDPDSAIKLATLEAQHQEALQALVNQDIANARSTDVALAASPFRAKFMATIACVFTLGLFFLIGIFFLYPLAQHAHDELYTLIMLLITVETGILRHYFGGITGVK